MQQIEKSDAQQSNLKRMQIRVFALTFLAYASVHTTRTSWSSAKGDFGKDVGISGDWYVGLMDSFFMFSYSITCAIFGAYGDRMDLRVFITVGMMTSALFFTFLGSLGFINASWFVFIYPLIIAGAGMFQASQWPGLVAVMGNWFGKGGRGLLMGVWSGDANVGNIIGYLIVGNLTIDVFGIGWQWCLILGSAVLFCVGLANYFLLTPYPEKLGFSIDEGAAQGGGSEPASPSLASPSQKTQSRLKTPQDQSPAEVSMMRHDIAKDRQVQDDKDFSMLRESVIDETAQNSAHRSGNESDVENGPAAAVTATAGATAYEDDEFDVTPIERTISHHLKNALFNETQVKMKPIEEQQFEEMQKVVRAQSLHSAVQRSASIGKAIAPDVDERPLNFFRAWLVPGVAIYAICNFCIKGSTYGMLFWLPKYLKGSKGLGDAAPYVSSMFDVGNFVGGILTGLMSDRLGVRASIIFPMLLIASVFMFVVNALTATTAGPYFALIFFTGFFLGGPYNIIISAVAIDLAKQPQLQGGKKSLSTITSVLNGVGSFGAAVVQLIVGLAGSGKAFPIFTVLCLVGAALFVPLVVREVRRLLNARARAASGAQSPLLVKRSNSSSAAKSK